MASLAISSSTPLRATAASAEKDPDRLEVDPTLRTGVDALMMDLKSALAGASIDRNGLGSSGVAPYPDPVPPPPGASPAVDKKAFEAQQVAAQAERDARAAERKAAASVAKYQANPTEDGSIDYSLDTYDANVARKHADAAKSAADSAMHWVEVANEGHETEALVGVAKDLATAKAEARIAQHPSAPRGGPDALRFTETMTLGSTTVTIIGGTAKQRATNRAVIQQMYDKDPGFRAAIDSKADTGENVRLEDCPEGVGGLAVTSGHTMAVDAKESSYDQGYAEIIAHELGHNIGVEHGPELDAFAETAAATVT